MEKIDTEILELFKKYYTLFKRDHPNNTTEALHAASMLTQAQIIKQGFIDNKPYTQPIPNYSFDLQIISSEIKNINSSFEQAKNDVIDACDRLNNSIKQYLD